MSRELRLALLALEASILSMVLFVGALVLFATADRLIPHLSAWACFAAGAWFQWAAWKTRTEERTKEPQR